MNRVVWSLIFDTAQLIDAKPEGFRIKARDQCVANQRRRGLLLRWQHRNINFTRDTPGKCKGIISVDSRLTRFHELIEGYGVTLGYIKNSQSTTIFDTQMVSTNK